MKIPIAKPFLSVTDAKAAYDVILSGWVTQGPKVQEFERKFADYIGSKYAVAVSSCTTALHLSLLVAGIKPGEEVICPSMTFIATANAIKHAGAVPVFAEVGKDYNLDITDVEKKITKRTKAILLVHQLGMPADIDAFKKLCKKYNLKLIEDAACAVGSVYKGKKIGAHSELVCFSFHPRKVITTGDGGMITTSNKKYYERLKLLRHHGMSVSDMERHLSGKAIKENYITVGYNYRMTDIQAAIGITQLEKLDYLIKERIRIAEIYNNAFKSIKGIVIPFTYTDRTSNMQSYSIYLNKSLKIKRDELIQKLLNMGISTRHGIMTIHREKAYADACVNVSLPVTENLSDNSILLPLYIPMKNDEIKYVIDNIKSFL